MGYPQKITEEDVPAMLQMEKDGLSHKAIGLKFGCAQTLVSRKIRKAKAATAATEAAEEQAVKAKARPRAKPAPSSDAPLPTEAPGRIPRDALRRLNGLDGMVDARERLDDADAWRVEMRRRADVRGTRDLVLLSFSRDEWNVYARQRSLPIDRGATAA